MGYITTSVCVHTYVLQCLLISVADRRLAPSMTHALCQVYVYNVEINLCINKRCYIILMLDVYC